MQVCRTLGLGVAIVVFASGGWAGVLNTEQTLRLQFTNLARASASDTKLQSVEATSPPLDEIRLSTPSLLSLNTVLPVTDPQVTCGGILEVRLTSVRPRPDLQGGLFGNLSAAVANPQVAISPATLPLEGQFRLCLLSTGCTGQTLDYPIGEETSSGGFVGAGVGGVLTVGGAFSTIMISVLGAPWTVNTVTVFQRTGQGALESVMNQGFAHGPVSNTGTTTLTSGVLRLVTVNQIHNVGIPGNSDRSGVFHELTIRFVPEPSRGILGLAAAIALAWLGRRPRPGRSG